MKKMMAALALSLLALPAKADVVFSFDDGWNSTHQIAFPIMKANGIVGTAYIATGQVGTDDFMPWNDIKDLADFAWEIGNHTVHHLDLTTIPYTKVQKEVAFAQADFAKHGITSETFASPYGETNPKIERLLRHEFLGARGAWKTAPSEVFSLTDKGVDRYNLPVFGVYSPIDLGHIENRLALSLKEHKHLIFMFHRIVENPTNKYEISSKDFQSIVDLCMKYNAKTVTLSNLLKGK
jgi:peptidoglycan/xylan/chitin deacetylase (PgdA/CDA1 family)